MALLETAKEADIPFFVMGNGSNLLVKDGGMEGLVIQLGCQFAAIEVDEVQNLGTNWEYCYIHAEAGALLSRIAAEAAEAGLCGLEFASGIPGSLGGGLFMNAGAYDGQLSEVVQSVLVMNPENGKLRELRNDEMHFGYRRSVLQETGEIALEATLMLSSSNKEDIRAKMDDFRARRTSKQPLAYPSAGSFFKRPEGHFAGALIEQAGLKGLTHGGAQVSELHAGFLINKGNATAADVLELAHMVQATVWNETGVKLEPEVRILGRD